jgi:hypothetical protein
MSQKPVKMTNGEKEAKRGSENKFNHDLTKEAQNLYLDLFWAMDRTREKRCCMTFFTMFLFSIQNLSRKVSFLPLNHNPNGSKW